MDPLKPSSREFIDRQIKECLETGDRQELAKILDDEVVIKRLEAARYSDAIARNTPYEPFRSMSAATTAPPRETAQLAAAGSRS